VLQSFMHAFRAGAFRWVTREKAPWSGKQAHMQSGISTSLLPSNTPTPSRKAGRQAWSTLSASVPGCLTHWCGAEAQLVTEWQLHLA
jgi:hypothetical protein